MLSVSQKQKTCSPVVTWGPPTKSAGFGRDKGWWVWKNAGGLRRGSAPRGSSGESKGLSWEVNNSEGQPPPSVEGCEDNPRVFGD